MRYYYYSHYIDRGRKHREVSILPKAPQLAEEAGFEAGRSDFQGPALNTDNASLSCLLTSFLYSHSTVTYEAPTMCQVLRIKQVL